MRERRETSPDAEMVLVVTRSGNDWIIAFEGSDWHTHPECITPFKRIASSDEDAVDDFVDCILSDRSIIAVSTSPVRRSIFVIDPDIDFARCNPPTQEAALREAIEADMAHAEAGERTVYRLWSGTVLHIG